MKRQIMLIHWFLRSANICKRMSLGNNPIIVTLRSSGQRRIDGLENCGRSGGHDHQ